MTEYLRGNYPLDVPITDVSPTADCNAFERAALARLGGSICFVAAAPTVWHGEHDR